MRQLAVVIAGLVALGCCSSSVTQSVAQGSDDGKASESSAHAVSEAVERGALIYRIRCAVCHGTEGQGDGPLTTDLLVRPTNLTRVWSPEDGAFPSDELRAAIDGRDEVRGHGSRDMPVWGMAFQQSGRVGGQEQQVSGQIGDLVEFIRSIQGRRPAAAQRP